jgi:hypothetical protein
MFGPDGQENVPHREWLIIFNKVVNSIKDDLKKKGREDEFVGARVCHACLYLPTLTLLCLVDHLLHSPLYQP